MGNSSDRVIDCARAARVARLSLRMRASDVLHQKAYCAWANAHLKRHGHPPISDLVMDCVDGTVLCVLVGSLTRTKVRGFKAHPVGAADKNANLSLALDTADAAGIPVSGITVEDFGNMDTNKVVAFFGLLFDKYETHWTDDALRARLSELAGGAPVADLTTALADGLLLYRIIDHLKPGLVNPATATGGADTLGNALYLLEQHFGVAHVLDAADFARADARTMQVVLPVIVEQLNGASGASPARHEESAKVLSRLSQHKAPTIKSPSEAPRTLASRASSDGREHVVAATSSPAATAVAEQAVPIVRGTSTRSFSKSVTATYPGVCFSSLHFDGRAEEKCAVCATELGNGKCFKWHAPGGGDAFAHSRCFSCAVCRKDFVQGVFYLADDGKLLCTAHAMERQGVTCKDCEKPISDFFVESCGALWHESCFLCKGQCKQPFTELAAVYDVKGRPHCRRCKAAAEGSICKKCKRGCVEPVRALDALWCPACFVCERCSKPLGSDVVDSAGWPYHADCLKAQEAASTAAPSGGAYAKPAQSAAARAKALKNRRSVHKSEDAAE